MTVWRPDLVVYHANCMDGYGAAWVVSQKWRDGVEFIPKSYGESAPDVSGKHVLIVDFSYKRSVIDELAQSAASIVILDHHKTARSELEPFTIDVCGAGKLTADDIDGILQDMNELGRPPIIARFDMEKSGARLAWEFIKSGEPPAFIQAIEDRDLWRFKHPGTREIHAALRSYPTEFDVWDKLSERRAGDLAIEGQSIIRSEKAILTNALKHAYTMKIAGHAVPVANLLLHFASDGAHELLKRNPDAPFSAVWCFGDDGKMHFSLRSEDHRMDVSEVAKKFNGGGHRNAAGFEISAPYGAWSEIHEG